MDSAEVAFPNPNDVVLAAIEDFDHDVSARVAADERLAEARFSRNECVKQQGVANPEEQDAMAQLSGQVSEIQASVAAGSMAPSQATTELASVKAKAIEVEFCYAPYYSVLEGVVDEVQRAELAARPELVPSILEQTDELMDLYRALLEDETAKGS